MKIYTVQLVQIYYCVHLFFRKILRGNFSGVSLVGPGEPYTPSDSSGD